MKCYSWPPRRRSKRLSVALPASVLVTEDTLELKTLKAGIIGRILAIHRVDEVVLYRDPETNSRDLRLLRILLEYMLTPPHLKKILHPLRKELRAAGLLPPLRTYNHEIPEELRPGVTLDSYIESCEDGICRAYLGKLGYGIIRGSYKPGDVITVTVKRVEGDVVELEESRWGDVYTGFKVKIIGDLEVIVGSYRRRGYLVVLSTKYGECAPAIIGKLGELLSRARGVLVIFGGPYRCPYEYTRRDLYDIMINTIPEQGTITVRTEEAMIATLTVVDLALSLT